MMPGRVPLLVAEGLWLSIVVALPAALNPWGALAFAPTKAGLLRALAVLMLAAWIAGRLAGGGRGRGNVGQQSLIRAGGLYFAALSLSSALSIQPLISLFGSYDRGTGLLTVAAGFSMALVAADLFTDARRRERAVVALVLGGAIPSLYGFIQYLGLDPFNWTGVVGVLSTLGSPTPLAGYLALVTPLALYAAAVGAHSLATSRAAGVATSVRYAAMLAVAIVAPLLVILATIRGPFVGLVAGLTIQGVAVGSGWGALAEWLRRPGRALVAAFLLLVLLAGSLTAAIALDVPLVARFADVMSPVGSGEWRGSAAERLIVWGETVRLMVADPPRMLVGFGPDTQAAVFERSEAIVRLGQHDRWDRAHNLLLEAWITSGLLGLGTLVVLLGLALRWAWVCATKRPSSMRQRALAAALLGALAAHVVEASFAFQGVTTGTIFWAVLGLTASLQAAPTQEQGEQAPARRPRRAWGTAILAMGVLLAPVMTAPAIADALQGASAAAGRRGRPLESAALADQAAVAAFWAEEPPRVAALALQARAGALGDPERVEGLFLAAEERFREAVARDHYDPFAHLRLVRHYLLRSERAVNDEDRRRLLQLAERSCQDGMRTGPFRTDVRVTCADVSQKLGRPGDEAGRPSAGEL